MQRDSAKRAQQPPPRWHREVNVESMEKHGNIWKPEIHGNSRMVLLPLSFPEAVQVGGVLLLGNRPHALAFPFGLRQGWIVPSHTLEREIWKRSC